MHRSDVFCQRRYRLRGHILPTPGGAARCPYFHQARQSPSGYTAAGPTLHSLVFAWIFSSRFDRNVPVRPQVANDYDYHSALGILSGRPPIYVISGRFVVPVVVVVVIDDDGDVAGKQQLSW